MQPCLSFTYTGGDPPPSCKVFTKIILRAPCNTYLPHKVSPTLEKVTLLCMQPLHAAKVIRALNNVSKATRSPQPQTGGPCRTINLDEEIGNQAQVVDLTQFVDLAGDIVAQLANVGKCQRRKITTPYVTYLTNTLATYSRDIGTPCTRGRVRHLCSSRSAQD